VLNLLRACETAIDLALHVVRVRDVAVHRYQDLDLDVLHAIVRTKFGGFERLVAALLRMRE